MTENDSKLPAKRPLKVVLVCHSDLLGGASIVTYRLMNALRHEGVDARMLVYTKTTQSPEVDVISSRFNRGFRFMAERLEIMARNGFSYANLFKVSTASLGVPVHRHPWVKEADVIVLSWINQGLLSLSGIRKLGQTGKPLVWTMHDMWCLTGICHHAYECSRYENECGCCPLLNSADPKDLSHKVWKKKAELYRRVPITFVAVSNWLAECCRRSSLLASRDVRVIPNAFPIDAFSTESTVRLTHYDLNPDKHIILMGAARLDDKIKGLDYAIDALNYLFDNHPETPRNSIAIFFGEVRDPSAFDRLRFPHYEFGRISDPTALKELYAAASVVLSTSLYETLPGTLIEGQASGCLPVTFDRGGQADIITHKVDGYLAPFGDIKEIAAGIIWALAEKPDRQALHDSVRRRFSGRIIARRYIDLFNELLSRSGKK